MGHFRNRPPADPAIDRYDHVLWPLWARSTATTPVGKSCLLGGYLSLFLAGWSIVNLCFLIGLWQVSVIMLLIAVIIYYVGNRIFTSDAFAAERDKWS